ncbi:MAG: hypothetical protein JWQ04_222, partial [Pedosphaera sp.]|nr:hypothetical protein [Pedosphaera sp.]
MRNADLDFVDGIALKIWDKQERGQSLTTEEDTVQAIWGASGIIGNGGFQYFFEQELDAEAVACAYDKIGCSECAELLRLALSLIPEPLFNATWNERIEFVERNKELFERLSSAFWKANKEVER